MNVQYLQLLRDNPYRYPNDIKFKIKGLSEFEISQLEVQYNNSNPFPKVLKELLFLAGKYCYGVSYGGLAEYGSSGLLVQQEMQEFARQRMQKYNKLIARPFYVIDLSIASQFLFMYLDEGDNPQLYDACPPEEDEWIEILPNATIKSYIDNAVNLVKKGESPY